MDNFDRAIDELKEKAASADKIENLEATIGSLEEKIKALQDKHDKLKEETEAPANTREYETMTYRAIKDLRSEIETIKANTTPKGITKEEILAIPDRSRRLKAISEHMDLFQAKPEAKPIDAYVESDLRRLGITEAVLDKMTIADAQKIKSDKTRLYVIEQLLRRA